jgi:hypothetical protein
VIYTSIKVTFKRLTIKWATKQISITFKGLKSYYFSDNNEIKLEVNNKKITTIRLEMKQ